MNDKDNPFGVGGGGERTVIRPNPGNRLPSGQPPPAPGSPSLGMLSKTARFVTAESLIVSTQSPRLNR